jgi:hypothetical protein
MSAAIDVGPVRAFPIQDDPAYPRRAGVGLIFAHNGDHEPVLEIDVLASNAALVIELRPESRRIDGYFRFRILLPDGTRLTVHGSDHQGYAATLHDENGHYLDHASKPREPKS